MILTVFLIVFIYCFADIVSQPLVSEPCEPEVLAPIVSEETSVYAAPHVLVEAPQPVQVLEEPCEPAVLEPVVSEQTSVYVAPPPAPALLELPPVVRRM